MQVSRNSEALAGIGQRDGRLVFLAEAAGRFDQRDELAEDLWDVAPVDLVDDQDVGGGRDRPEPRPRIDLKIPGRSS